MDPSAASGSTGGRSSATAARRAAILEAALQVFIEKGVAGATMDDVHRRSGASIGSIYHHFGSKEEVAAALYVGGLRDYQDGCLAELERHEAPEAAIKAVVRHHVGWIVEHRDLARFLFHHREPELLLATGRSLRDANRLFFAAVRAWLEARVEAGTVRPLPFDLYYALWIAPAQEFGRHWLLGRTRTPVEQAAAVLADAAWQALRDARGAAER